MIDSAKSVELKVPVVRLNRQTCIFDSRGIDEISQNTEQVNKLTTIMFRTWITLIQSISINPFIARTLNAVLLICMQLMAQTYFKLVSFIILLGVGRTWWGERNLDVHPRFKQPFEFPRVQSIRLADCGKIKCMQPARGTTDVGFCKDEGTQG